VFEVVIVHAKRWIGVEYEMLHIIMVYFHFTTKLELSRGTNEPLSILCPIGPPVLVISSKWSVFTSVA
jgi:hypothetical protein